MWFPRLTCAGILASVLLLACSEAGQQRSAEPTATQASAITLPSGFVEENLGTTWTQAVGLTFAADGRLFVWERQGRVYEVDENGERRDEPLIDISQEVANFGDHGLLGLALHPNFLNNGYIYLLYAVDHHHLLNAGTPNYDPLASDPFVDTIGRVTRYQARSSDGFTSVDPDSRAVLLGDTIDSGCPLLYDSHGVGTLLFGADGTLLVSCGDGASYDSVDAGGTTGSNTGFAEGIAPPEQNIGAYRAQQIDSFAGKVLRLDATTGDGIPSNPFYNAAAPRSARSRVWSLGLRNPFRMTLRPESGEHDPSAGNPGTLYIGDVGWLEWEELNVAASAGLNFGWPVFEGQSGQSNYVFTDPGNPYAPNQLFNTTPAGRPFCNQRSFPFASLIAQESLNPIAYGNPCDQDDPIPARIPVFEHARPVIAWGHQGTQTRVPGFSASGAATSLSLGAQGAPAGTPFSGTCASGGVWYTGDDFPAAYKNTFFMADYVAGWIHNLSFNAQNQLLEVRPFAPTGQTPIVALATHPVDGSLYYVSYGNTVRRIRYIGSGNRPPIANAEADLEYGPAPLAVQFTGDDSTDPELGPLTYSWNFGDGSAPSNQANPAHTFAPGGGAAAGYDVVLTVTDVAGASAQSTVRVVVNDSPPNVVVELPVDGGVYSATGASMVDLSAVASDSEQNAASLACSWQTILHHNEHSHAELPVPGCVQATHVSGVGCGDETYYFEFKAAVTDSMGLSDSQSVILFPDCTPTVLAPSGISTVVRPSYQWRRVLGADQYELEVTDSGGVRVQQVLAAVDAGCGDNEPICAVTPPVSLSEGLASIRMRARNAAVGWRGWSNALEFSVDTSVCGNAVVDSGEACDDGNAVDGDGCNSDCSMPTCSDEIQNQGEVGVDCGGPCIACELLCQSDPLSRVSATTSSTEGAGYDAANAIDGSPTTRWASGHSDPQWISVDLGTVQRVRRVVLYWEDAASANYDIQVASSAAGPWTTVFTQVNGAVGIADIGGLNVNARYVRMYSRARVLSAWGNSLWEFEVYGDPSSSCGACGNGSLDIGEQCDDGNAVDIDACSNQCRAATCSDGEQNQGETAVDCGGPCAVCVVCGDGNLHATEECDDGNTVDNDSCNNDCLAASCDDGDQNQGETAIDCGGPACASCALLCHSDPLPRLGATTSSLEGAGYAAGNAIDGSLSTRWASGHSDPQWISVDLGALKRVRRVVLRWEAAAARDYDVQVASSASGPWTTVFTEPSGTPVVKNIDGLNVNARYVRMYSRARVLTAWGNSLFEFEIYGDPSTTCGACGNGSIDIGEQCDDGNGVDDDACDNQCSAATCSDGQRNQGETGVDCGGPCAACIVCGDGIRQATEQCDDGNGVDNDTCSNACQTATCSDGRRNQGETAVDCGGPCSACVVCGDGIRQATEQCDDGNTVDNDTCSNACQTATCSDGRRNQGETAVDCGGPCADCVVCGDGNLHATEECDDGNTVDNDSCNNDCLAATCSDGDQNQGETGIDCGGPACASCALLCRSDPLLRLGATTSSLEGAGYAAGNAIDGSLSTRWASGHSDPQWLSVDLGALKRVRRVVLRWEAAAARDYDIQVANSASGPWTTVFTEPSGTPVVKNIDGLNVNARYVRMYSRARVLTAWGNSLFEFEIYGDPSTTCGACGNGSLDIGEQCDDGNLIDGDACSNECASATCSDGDQNQGETGVDCGGPCAVCIVCGDGNLHATEECDDGNSVDNDACNNDCLAATCSDGDQNQGETGIDCGGPCLSCALICRADALQRVAAAASSVEAFGFDAPNAIDGSLTTRWASGHSDPQWLRVDLGVVKRVRRVVLRWEDAASANYDIQVATNVTGPWTTVFNDPSGAPGVDNVDTLDVNARYVRMYSRARVLSAWGNSLWELEVYGDPNTTCGQ